MEEKEIPMEEQIPLQEASAQENPEPYKPRPRWQVWAARIGLVIVIIAVILYYYHIAWGGR